MTSKTKSISYTLSVSSAQKQIREAEDLYILAKSLLETYLCSDKPVKYRDDAVKLLIDYSYNSRMYGETLVGFIETGKRIQNEKTGKESIVVDLTGFSLINAYVAVMANCENELETLGISMRIH